MNTIFSHYPQRKRFDYANFSIPSTPKNDFLPSFWQSLQKKSFYFITDISAQICPLMPLNYFPSHLKRTNFHRMTICNFVNFLWMKKRLSYYNLHFFFKKQVSNQKIFCLQTKRTFFQRMDTPTIVKFLLTVSHTPLSWYNVHFFRKNQGAF